MLTKIQKRPPEQQDAISWLLACHQRIRHFTALAQKLASGVAATPEEVKEAAESVLRYFTVALPLHEQDEERSLLPRLMGKDPALDHALSLMQQEHRQIDTALAVMLPLLAHIIQDPNQRAVHTGELETQVKQLEALWQPHLRREEEVIFVAAERSLDASEKDALMREMKARRSDPP
jgi:iron-sulfur cluster repair protein YtfE (RIC family)